jgi:hypothetical protein
MPRWFEGSGWFVGGAVVLFVFSALALSLALQSPQAVLWTGQAVTGTEQGGIVYYHWQGQPYTIDARGYGSAKAVTVYLDPGNPSNAMVNDYTDRVGTGLLVGLPALAGVVLLIVGLVNGRRWRRRNASTDNTFWLSKIPPGSRR